MSRVSSHPYRSMNQPKTSVEKGNTPPFYVYIYICMHVLGTMSLPPSASEVDRQTQGGCDVARSGREGENALPRGSYRWTESASLW